MQNQVNNIEKKVDKMYEAMIGDEFREGIVLEVKKNSKHRKNSVKTSGFVAGVSIVLGGLIGQFWDGIIHIFTA